MTRAELKRNAREKLGGQLFGPNWVNAVLVMASFLYTDGSCKRYRRIWNPDHVSDRRPFKLRSGKIVFTAV